MQKNCVGNSRSIVYQSIEDSYLEKKWKWDKCLQSFSFGKLGHFSDKKSCKRSVMDLLNHAQPPVSL